MVDLTVLDWVSGPAVHIPLSADEQEKSDRPCVHSVGKVSDRCTSASRGCLKRMRYGVLVQARKVAQACKAGL